MSSNGLSLSQWNSVYANQISAPLTSKLRLETVRQSSIVIGEPGGSREVEFDEVEVDEVEIAKIESQTAKYKVMNFR